MNAITTPLALPLWLAALSTVPLAAGLAAQQPVQVVRAVRTALTDQVSLPGKVVAEARLALKARVTGYLAEVPVDYGSEVEKGGLLARIEVPDLEARHQRQQAALAAAAAEVGDAEARLELAQARIDDAKGGVAVAVTEVDMANVHVERIRKLAEKGGVTQQGLDEAEGELAIAKAHRLQANAALATAEARVRAARAAVASAEARRKSSVADVKEAAQQVEFARLVCPFERAVVTMRSLDPGALVRMNEDVILQLQQTDKLRAEFRVPEQDAARVRVGMSVDLRFDALPDPMQGVVARTAGALSESKVMIVQVDLDNAAGKLMPGMFVYATLLFAVQDSALTLPARTLRVAADGGLYVLVVKDGKAMRADVTIGADNGVRVQVESGLEGSEDVILVGNVEDGAAVRIVGSSR